MPNAIFLSTNKYLTLPEATKYLKKYFLREEISPEEILHLINKKHIKCFLECSKVSSLDAPYTKYKNYTGYSIGMQKLVNPNIKYDNKKTTLESECVYYLVGDKSYLIGDFHAKYNSDLEANYNFKGGVFKDVLQFTEYAFREYKNFQFKVDSLELYDFIKSLNPDDFLKIPQNIQSQKEQQSQDAQKKIIEKLRAENEKLKETIKKSPTNSTFVIAGALIDILVMKKTADVKNKNINAKTKKTYRSLVELKLDLESMGLSGMSEGALNKFVATANKHFDLKVAQKFDTEMKGSEAIKAREAIAASKIFQETKK